MTPNLNLGALVGKLRNMNRSAITAPGNPLPPEASSVPISTPALPKLPRPKPLSPSAPLRAGRRPHAVHPLKPNFANMLRGLNR